MTTGNSAVSKALEWILERLRQNPEAKKADLIDEAGRRFDLTPLDGEFLVRYFTRIGAGNSEK